MWNKYIPVKERKVKAMNKIKKLQKKGMIVNPILVEGRTISKKFWGKKWNRHIENFADYDNRLPRGRTYVRNGSVCHLDIQKGLVTALISGSMLYNTSIRIDLLPKDKWENIKKSCKGQVESILSLLQGKLSDHVMEAVTDEKKGLFPCEKEINFNCDCPDWADMCKHVAAVLYGIANRLDDQPELLFLLRGVDPKELINTELSLDAKKTENQLEQENLADIFGIDLEI